MKIEKKYILLTLIMAIIGYWASKYFLELTLIQLNTENINIIGIAQEGLSKYDLFFAFSIGLIPLVYSIIDKYSNLKSLKQTLLVLIIILLIGTIFWQLKIYLINYWENIVSSSILENDISSSVNVNSLKLGKYFAFGCLFGAIVSLLIFRKINMAHIVK